MAATNNFLSSIFAQICKAGTTRCRRIDGRDADLCRGHGIGGWRRRRTADEAAQQPLPRAFFAAIQRKQRGVQPGRKGANAHGAAAEHGLRNGEHRRKVVRCGQHAVVARGRRCACTCAN